MTSLHRGSAQPSLQRGQPGYLTGKKRYAAGSRVTLAELLLEVRSLPRVARTSQPEPSEDRIRKRIRELHIKSQTTTREGARRTTVSRAEATRILESFRIEGAATFFDAEMQGFLIEPDPGSSDERIGQALPTVYVLVPPGGHVDDPGPSRSLFVSTEELLEFFQSKNSLDAEAMERLRQRFRDRLPGKPEVLAVVLCVHGSDLDSYLQAIVATVPVPKFPGENADDLKRQAFAHLRMKVFPQVAGSKNPRAFLRVAIRNFYRDVAASGEDLVSLEELPDRTSLALGLEPKGRKPVIPRKH